MNTSNFSIFLYWIIITVSITEDNMFSSSDDLTKRYYYRTNSKKLQTLCVYGDSMGVHYHKLAKSRPLCKEMFLECNNKYMWIYDVSFKTCSRQVLYL